MRRDARGDLLQNRELLVELGQPSGANAQVFELQERLRAFRIGTVDKFQGQEAPVVIYSMTTSSAEDVPRGLDFLFDLRRLNVATSRAQAAAIVVASPKLLEAECKTPDQMRLMNAFCAAVEVAR